MHPASVRPRPYKYDAGSTTLALRAPFTFKATGVQSPLLTDTLARFTDILQAPASDEAAGAEGPESGGAVAMSGCNVHVASADEALNVHTDESYNMSVPSTPGSYCSIKATTVYGAMRGLETFAALWNTADQTFGSAPLTVQDKPRFKYRGLMQDTARHYLPLAILFDHLEAMSMAKLNVFHWHLTDAQSWPLELESLPLAAKMGAYDPVHATYSAADVKKVVDYAKRRGIRVIPELDMPAYHFESVLKGYPSWGAGVTVTGEHSGNLDPTNEAMWRGVAAMFAELAGLFPDESIHVGFDEVDLTGWNTTAIAAWMGKHAMSELKDVETYFMNRVRTIAEAHGKKLTIWDGASVLPALFGTVCTVNVCQRLSCFPTSILFANVYPVCQRGQIQQPHAFNWSTGSELLVHLASC